MSVERVVETKFHNMELKVTELTIIVRQLADGANIYTMTSNVFHFSFSFLLELISSPLDNYSIAFRDTFVNSFFRISRKFFSLTL